jgi:septation ring formation regulator EzrA
MILLTSDISGADIVTTYKTLVFVMGAVLAVWGFIKVLKEINKPLTDLRKTVEDHSEKISDIEKHLEKSDKGMGMVQKSLLQIMNHMIDGNHTDQLAKARDDMQNYLTEK